MMLHTSGDTAQEPVLGDRENPRVEPSAGRSSANSHTTTYWLAVRFYPHGPVKRLECFSMTERALMLISLGAQHVEIVGMGIGVANEAA